ncbi:MAG: DUF2520 domain-containing protein, partial [Acidihalobacter sp.]
WQNYIDLAKNIALRSKISHGVMFYLGPVFRLTGGVGLLLFVPTIYGSVMWQNFSFAGDLILALYFVFFGTLGMALAARLQEVAGLLGMRVLHLPPGARARYHGAASFAASFLVSMLEEAAAIWASFGVGEDDALEALLPLAYGTLDAARSKGFAGALAGPLSRGDAGVVQGHLRDLDRLGAGHGALYREFARRQLDLLERGGRLDQTRLWPMRELLGNEGKS